MTGDPLDRIEEREVSTGPRFLTLWEQSALVEVARAAREAEDTLRAYGTGVHLIGARHKLKAALARLDGDR